MAETIEQTTIASAAATLKAAGYRSHGVPSFRHADAFYQKRVRDADGKTRYFINAFIYDYKESVGLGVSVDYEVAMYRGDDHFTIGAHSLRNPHEAEAFFEQAYSCLCMDTDPHNN